MAAFDAADRQQLGDTVRAVLADCRDDVESEAVWTGLREVGALSILVPEEHGGLAGSLADAAAVAAELGRAQSGVPFVSAAVLASSALMHADNPAAAQRWLAALGTGEARGTVALDATLTWSPATGGHHVAGALPLVLDAPGCDVLIVSALDPRGEPAWFALTAPTATVEEVPLHDGTRRAGRVTVDRVIDESDLLASGRPAVELGGLLLDIAACMIGVDAAAGARAALDLTVEYARTRHQFGHPIGAFQAVKHACADMYVDVVASRTAVDAALDALEEPQRWDAAERGLHCSIAKAQATERYVRVAGSAMQLHGGIGFTWEHAVQRHLKRALLDDHVHGTRLFHQQRVWSHIRAPGPSST